MNFEQFDIPADAPVDAAFLKDAKKDLSGITKGLMTGKMEEAKLLSQSAAEGGPSSAGEAFVSLVANLGLGIRQIAKRAGVRRQAVKRMLEGDIAITPEVSDAIYQEAKRKDPGLFAFEKE